MSAHDTQKQPTRQKGWNHHPPLPMEQMPLFLWPLKLRRVLDWYRDNWFSLGQRVLFVLLALVAWYGFSPTMAEAQTLSWGWVLQVYLRNAVLLIGIAGALHLYLYTFAAQGQRLKYDPRDLMRDNGRFRFRNQVYDNMFWTLASGLTIWTLFEVLMLWAAGKGWVPLMADFWDTQAHHLLWWLWFVCGFLFITLWSAFHFYWIHRFLHWPPLYKAAHALHHRNINVGPWSGISMHPIEHALYFSSIFIHFVVPTHPAHMLFHWYWLTLSAVTSHCGFEGLWVKDKSRLALGSFFHQLHHRHFECNYGNVEMPWDRWFGSYHDGTPESLKAIRERAARIGRSKVETSGD